MNNLLIDAAGFNALNTQIASISHELKAEMKTHINPGSGNIHGSLDPVHDINRISFLQSVLRELKYIRSISTLISKEDMSSNTSSVSINDIVKIVLSGANIYEERVVRLVFSLGIEDAIDGIDDISINSPLARAILNKQVGSISKFKVNDKDFSVSIIEKESPHLEVTLN